MGFLHKAGQVLENQFTAACCGCVVVVFLAVGDVHFELDPAITLLRTKWGRTFTNSRDPGLVMTTDHAPNRQCWVEAGPRQVRGSR